MKKAGDGEVGEGEGMGGWVDGWMGGWVDGCFRGTLLQGKEFILVGFICV
jgi:hypothetical protein